MSDRRKAGRGYLGAACLQNDRSSHEFLRGHRGPVKTDEGKKPYRLTHKSHGDLSFKHQDRSQHQGLAMVACLRTSMVQIARAR